MKVVLRGATVQFGVFEGEDVNRAFVTGGTEKWRVMAEVDAGENKQSTRNHCQSLSYGELAAPLHKAEPV